MRNLSQKFSNRHLGYLRKLLLLASSTVKEKIYKAQRNVILCASAILLYWSIYRICKYYKELQSLEEVEKRYKAQ